MTLQSTRAMFSAVLEDSASPSEREEFQAALLRWPELDHEFELFSDQQAGGPALQSANAMGTLSGCRPPQASALHARIDQITRAHPHRSRWGWACVAAAAAVLAGVILLWPRPPETSGANDQGAVPVERKPAVVIAKPSPTLHFLTGGFVADPSGTTVPYLLDGNLIVNVPDGAECIFNCGDHRITLRGPAAMRATAQSLANRNLLKNFAGDRARVVAAFGAARVTLRLEVLAGTAAVANSQGSFDVNAGSSISVRATEGELRTESRFARLDLNQDGVLRDGELTSGLSKLMDKNRDGSVNLAEFRRVVASVGDGNNQQGDHQGQYGNQDDDDEEDEE